MKTVSLNLALFLVISILMLHPSPVIAQDQYLYWFEEDGSYIVRGDLETSLIDTLSQFKSIIPSAFDIVDGELYWFNQSMYYPPGTGVVMKGNPKKSKAEELFTLEGVSVKKIRVDIKNEHIYWLEERPYRIRRAKMNGSETQDLVAADYIKSFRIDAINNKLYWTESNAIRRSNMDGSLKRNVVTGISGLHDIEVDVDGDCVYWLQYVENDCGIFRSAINRGDPELILDNLPIQTELMTIDHKGGKIYWAGEYGTQRGDLDGSQIEDILTIRHENLNDLIIDGDNNILYWNEYGYEYHGGRRILSVDIEDGSIREVLQGFGQANSTVIDPWEKIIYWTTGGLNEVMKSKMDGSEIHTILRRSSNWWDPAKDKLAFDRESGVLCWGYTHGEVPPLFRCLNVAGTLITFGRGVGQIYYDYANFITFDSFNRYIYVSLVKYWEGWECNITRIPLDFNNNDDFWIVVNTPDFNSSAIGIALDFQNQKLYWSEGAGFIKQSNLDGYDIEVLLTDLKHPRDLKLDVQNGKMYWCEKESGLIRRANLDGTEIEDLFTGLSSPADLAFTFENNGRTTHVIPRNIPDQFTLSQNYPNPFNPVTTIEYSLPEQADVVLEIFDLLGRRVAELVDEKQNPGVYRVNWGASNTASGLYLYRLRAGEYSRIKQMILLR